MANVAFLLSAFVSVYVDCNTKATNVVCWGKGWNLLTRNSIWLDWDNLTVQPIVANRHLSHQCSHVLTLR